MATPSDDPCGHSSASRQRLGEPLCGLQPLDIHRPVVQHDSSSPRALDWLLPPSPNVPTVAGRGLADGLWPPFVGNGQQWAPDVQWTSSVGGEDGNKTSECVVWVGGENYGGLGSDEHHDIRYHQMGESWHRGEQHFGMNSSDGPILPLNSFAVDGGNEGYRGGGMHTGHGGQQVMTPRASEARPVEESAGVMTPPPAGNLARASRRNRGKFLTQLLAAEKSDAEEEELAVHEADSALSPLTGCASPRRRGRRATGRTDTAASCNNRELSSATSAARGHVQQKFSQEPGSGGAAALQASVWAAVAEVGGNVKRGRRRTPPTAAEEGGTVGWPSAAACAAWQVEEENSRPSPRGLAKVCLELRRRIVKLLPVRDMIRVQQTCRAMREAVQSHAILSNNILVAACGSLQAAIVDMPVMPEERLDIWTDPVDTPDKLPQSKLHGRCAALLYLDDGTGLEEPCLEDIRWTDIEADDEASSSDEESPTAAPVAEWPSIFAGRTEPTGGETGGAAFAISSAMEYRRAFYQGIAGGGEEAKIPGGDALPCGEEVVAERVIDASGAAKKTDFPEPLISVVRRKRDRQRRRMLRKPKKGRLVVCGGYGMFELWDQNVPMRCNEIWEWDCGSRLWSHPGPMTEAGLSDDEDVRFEDRDAVVLQTKTGVRVLVFGQALHNYSILHDFSRISMLEIPRGPVEARVRRQGPPPLAAFGAVAVPEEPAPEVRCFPTCVAPFAVADQWPLRKWQHYKFQPIDEAGKKFPVPSARECFSSTLLRYPSDAEGIKGQVILFGGYDGARKCCGDVWLLEFVKEPQGRKDDFSWTFVHDVEELTPNGLAGPSPRFGHTMTAIGRDIILFGGRTDYVRTRGKTKTQRIFTTASYSISLQDVWVLSRDPAKRFAHLNNFSPWTSTANSLNSSAFATPTAPSRIASPRRSFSVTDELPAFTGSPEEDAFLAKCAQTPSSNAGGGEDCPTPPCIPIYPRGGAKSPESCGGDDPFSSSWSVGGVRSKRSALRRERGFGTPRSESASSCGGMSENLALGMTGRTEAEGLHEWGWFRPKCKGRPPPARTSHRATAVGCHVIVFAGFSGKYTSDLYSLHASTYTWDRIEFCSDPMPAMKWLDGIGCGGGTNSSAPPGKRRKRPCSGEGAMENKAKRQMKRRGSLKKERSSEEDEDVDLDNQEWSAGSSQQLSTPPSAGRNGRRRGEAISCNRRAAAAPEPLVVVEEKAEDEDDGMLAGTALAEVGGLKEKEDGVVGGDVKGGRAARKCRQSQTMISRINQWTGGGSRRAKSNSARAKGSASGGSAVKPAPPPRSELVSAEGLPGLPIDPRMEPAMIFDGKDCLFIFGGSTRYRSSWRQIKFTDFCADLVVVRLSVTPGSPATRPLMEDPTRSSAAMSQTPSGGVQSPISKIASPSAKSYSLVQRIKRRKHL